MHRLILAFVLIFACGATASAEGPAPMGAIEQAQISAAFTKAWASSADGSEKARVVRDSEIARIVAPSGGRFAWTVTSAGVRWKNKDGSVGFRVALAPWVWIQTYLGPRDEDPYRSLVVIDNFDLNAAMRDAPEGTTVKVTGEIVLKDGLPVDAWAGNGDLAFGHDESDPALIVRFTSVSAPLR